MKMRCAECRRVSRRPEFLRKIKKIAKILGGRMGIMVDIFLLGTAG